METEKMQFNIVSNNGEPVELIIREGKAPDLLPNLTPIKLNLTGTIGSPVEFLTRRPLYGNEFVVGSHVLVDRKNISIKLVIRENSQEDRGEITGKLEEHPKFKEFGINQGKSWEPNELGQFFKMNKFYFADASENMKLVTDLLNFEANITSKIEKQKSEKGDFKDNYSGAVTSNLPGKFNLKVPIFKGYNSDIIEVEFYAAVYGRTVGLMLVSPGANQLLESLRDNVLDEQINAIRELAPNIVIIEV